MSDHSNICDHIHLTYGPNALEILGNESLSSCVLVFRTMATWVPYKIEIRVFDGIWRRGKCLIRTLYFINTWFIKPKTTLFKLCLSLSYPSLYLWLNVIEMQKKIPLYMETLLVLVLVPFNIFVIKDSFLLRKRTVDCPFHNSTFFFKLWVSKSI